MEISFLLLLFLLSCVVIRNKGVISYGSIFLLLFLSFHFVPLFYLYFNLDTLNFDFSPEKVAQAVLKSTTICIAVILGYLLTLCTFRAKRGNAFEKSKSLSLKFWKQINLVVGAVIIINNIPVAHQALTHGYIDIYAQPSIFLPIRNVTIFPIYVFSLFYLIFARINSLDSGRKKIGYLFSIVFILVVLSFLLTGSRSIVIYLMLSLVALLSSKYKFKISTYAPHTFGIVMITALVGLIRDGSIFDINASELLLRPVIELLNTSIILFNYESIIDKLNVTGVRYLAGLLLLFPATLLSSLGLETPLLLSQQYVNTIDPGWADAGGGFGFSLVVEYYLLGGSWWAWFPALLSGMTIGLVDFYVRSFDISKAVLANSLGFFMFFAIRGEIIELFRPIAVILFLYFLNRMYRSLGSMQKSQLVKL